MLNRSLDETIVQLGKKYRNIVVLTSDNSKRAGVAQFTKFFQDRSFNFGLAEANMASSAVGFTVCGKVPFVTGVASFLVNSALDQIRSDICYPNLNVKIIGTAAGLSASQDEVGCQAMEDLALMRALPNMKVVSPADYYETASALEAMMADYGPTYLRICDGELPAVYDANCRFEFGKVSLVHGKEFVEDKVADLCIFATGAMVWRSIEVAKELLTGGKKAVVVNVASIKPLDVDGILKLSNSLTESGFCVTVEDHSVIGGLGSAVSEVMCSHGSGRKVVRLGVEDKFLDSARSEDLYEKNELEVSGLLRKISGLLGV